MKKKIYLLMLLCFVLLCNVKAQPYKPNIKLGEILFNNINVHILPDSIAFYPYVITIVVNKSTDNVIEKSIIASDSTVFKIMPNYKKLLGLNLEEYLGNKTRLEYRVPVLIQHNKPAPSQKHLAKDYPPNIRIFDATFTFDKLIKLFKLDEINEDKIVLQHSLITYFIDKIP